MSRFLKVMTVAAAGFVLAGCAGSEFSMGSLSPSVEKRYEITGAGYGESFEEARRAVQEADLEIVHADEDRGTIAVQVKGSAAPFQDVRTITSRPGEFVFALERPEPDRLVFTVRSNGSRREGVERFLQAYGRKVEFAESGDSGEAAETKGSAVHEESVDERVITEIRTGSPYLPEEKHDFTRQEILEIQAFLYKLGYDPGPADGTMNDKTRAAIEKFTKEYKFVKKLF